MSSVWASRESWWIWLAIQLACTSWILLSAILVGIAGQWAIAAVVLVLFALVNGLGFVMWHSRRKFSLRTVVTVMLLFSCLVGVVVIYVIDAVGLWKTIQVGPWVYPANFSYGVVVSVHIAVLLFLRLGPLRNR